MLDSKTENAHSARKSIATRSGIFKKTMRNSCYGFQKRSQTLIFWQSINTRSSHKKSQHKFRFMIFLNMSERVVSVFKRTTTRISHCGWISKTRMWGRFFSL